MTSHIHIPMFPLTLLPLPGELVPLHIFEPRYRELLQDAENKDITFGIYFNHSINVEKMGSLMKLESVIKRYPGGESDIIVKCIDIFKLDTLFRTFKTKPYPGGDAHLIEEDNMLIPSEGLYDLFSEYMMLRNIKNHFTAFDYYQIANELALDVHERYKLLTATADGKEKFLKGQLKFQLHILKQEEQSKGVFHLN
jgi:uncharacterized protein